MEFKVKANEGSRNLYDKRHQYNDFIMFKPIITRVLLK